jgi:hypothetical protein
MKSVKRSSCVAGMVPANRPCCLQKRAGSIVIAPSAGLPLADSLPDADPEADPETDPETDMAAPLAVAGLDFRSDFSGAARAAVLREFI